jgi:hypothetical protein
VCYQKRIDNKNVVLYEYNKPGEEEEEEEEE